MQVIDSHPIGRAEKHRSPVAMLAHSQCEALERAVAAEVAASILDVAIGRNRAPALSARWWYVYYKRQERSYTRRARSASPPWGDFFQGQADFYRGLKEEAYSTYIRVYKGYREDREWQNLRWGLHPAAHFSALPEEVRRLR